MPDGQPTGAAFHANQAAGKALEAALVMSAEAIRRATAIVGLVREDFERCGISTKGLEPA